MTTRCQECGLTCDKASLSRGLPRALGQAQVAAYCDLATTKTQRQKRCGSRAQRISACSSARVARYALRPPLRATSRLIVETARAKSRPSCPNDRPERRLRDISSRSIKLREIDLRNRGTGANPPFPAITPNTEAACLPKARPHSAIPQPSNAARVQPCVRATIQGDQFVTLWVLSEHPKSRMLR